MSSWKVLHSPETDLNLVKSCHLCGEKCVSRVISYLLAVSLGFAPVDCLYLSDSCQIDPRTACLWQDMIGECTILSTPFIPFNLICKFNYIQTIRPTRQRFSKPPWLSSNFSDKTPRNSLIAQKYVHLSSLGCPCVKLYKTMIGISLQIIPTAAPFNAHIKYPASFSQENVEISVSDIPTITNLTITNSDSSARRAHSLASPQFLVPLLLSSQCRYTVLRCWAIVN